MNILFRYGEFHNQTVAFPARSTSFMYPNLFSASLVDGFSEGLNKTFNIMCHHMRFRFTEVETVMPDDTFYFTILRNPTSHMESTFSYYKGATPFRQFKTLEQFLSNASAYYDRNMRSGFYAKNFMTFDLGFENNGRDTTKNLQIRLRVIEEIFDLVLITEYFDESLILLKEALCWSFDDVLSIPLNSRSNSTKKDLSLEIQKKIQTWNNLDWPIYSYFNNSFWKRVEKFGWERMKREVNTLLLKRAEVTEKCLQGEVDPQKLKDKSLMPYQSGSARILGYNLKPDLPAEYKLLCQRLVTPELQYSALLHHMQKSSQAGTDITEPPKNLTKPPIKPAKPPARLKRAKKH
ncbi:galactose-3-O-sulfotransferase 2-like [Hyperolius riggenbachi]|uniref:galactose-3-O-sulfotransferase 2-like n=1 Tax=Hyperolius riggenbachi TaxID=752182 RepID=UPI0035A2E5E0